MIKVLEKKKDKILKVLAIVGMILALSLATQNNSLVMWVGTISLIAGFANALLTAKRSKWFIIPDMIWIGAMLYQLFMNGNYTDMLQYAFYIMIGFIQFFEWSMSEKNSGEVIPLKLDMIAYSILPITVILVITSINLGGNFALLGAIASSLSIVGAVLLAQRYYFGEIMFLVANVINIYILCASGLGNTSLVTIYFTITNIIFLLTAYNKIEKR